MSAACVAIWAVSAGSQEQLIGALKEWCRDAEATGIEALERFAQNLRTYRLGSPPA